MDAREWLDSVTQAARLVRAEGDREAVMRNAALGLSRRADSMPSGGRDAMALVDSIADLEATRKQRMASSAREVARAREVFDGMRLVGKLEADAATVLEGVHVGLMGKSAVARSLGVSRSTVKRRYSYGLDWLDAHGMARAREGMGAAS